MNLTTLVGEPWADYGLIDSGDGRKLERYGPYRFIRPEPQAMWAPASDDWQAHAEFVPGSDEEGGGRWYLTDRSLPQSWPLEWREVRFASSCTPFRHLGFFPDMAPVWDWMRGRLDGLDAPTAMNLFGYTGVGTLALSAGGANMVHVDASKKSVAAARENAALSGTGSSRAASAINRSASVTTGRVAATTMMTKTNLASVKLSPSRY